MTYMTKEDYDILESSGHFHRQEFKDDPYQLDRGIVFILRNMRIESGHPCAVHCGWADGAGHSTNSWHYKGRALDVNFKEMSLVDQVKLAYKHGCTGIGAYPTWHEPGIHIDNRDGRPVYWIEKVKGSGEYTYFHDFDEFVTTLGSIA